MLLPAMPCCCDEQDASNDNSPLPSLDALLSSSSLDSPPRVMLRWRFPLLLLLLRPRPRSRAALLLLRLRLRSRAALLLLRLVSAPTRQHVRVGH
jgi:hypothetical protein